MPAPPPESVPAIVSARETWRVGGGHRKWSHPSASSGRSAPSVADRDHAVTHLDVADRGERHAEGLAELRCRGLDRLRTGKRRRAARSPRRRRAPPPSVAPSATGTSPIRRRAPTPLAAASRERSIARPSDTSIIAVAPWRASTAPSPTRARRPQVRAQQRAVRVGPAPGRRWRPAARRPTRRARPSRRPRSPGRAPDRVTARPGATSPVDRDGRSPPGRPRDRSPPTSQRAYSSQASRIPPNSSITHAASSSSRERERDSAARGLRAHRGDVADVHDDRLVSQVARRT